MVNFLHLLIFPTFQLDCVCRPVSVWQQEVWRAPRSQVVGGELWLHGGWREEERSRQTQYVLMGMLAEVLRSELHVYSRKYAHENVGWSITHRIILSKICSGECRQGYYA